jgi:membrane associated rhomboid family serine protease
MSRPIGNAGVLLGFLAVMWVLELIDSVVLGSRLDAAGIRPRDLDQWWAIFAAPFLHGGLAHLVANTVPLLVLGWLVLLRGAGIFAAVSLAAIVVGGVGVWLLGRPGSIHLGASGVVFGYLGYLLLRGYFERSFGAIAVALLVAVIYGGALFGVLPGQRGISWEGHLFGFLGGVAAARVLTSSAASSRRVPPTLRRA